MRLLYLVDHWPGIFEAYLFREIRWMRHRGHNVSIVSLGVGGPHSFRNETKDYVELRGFDLGDLPVLHLASKHKTAETVIEEALTFADVHGAQIIDAHLAREPAEVACEMHFESGIPFAVRMRGGDVHSRPSARLGEIVGHAAAICPMSRFLADVLVGNRSLKQMPSGIPVRVATGRLHVVPNSLPQKYLSAAPAGQSETSQVVGAIGRLVPVKRFGDLIEAVAGLAGEFPGLRLQIIGGGELQPQLQSLAAEAGLAGRFEITGSRSWVEVMALARRIHIYAQTSELEGCSLATIEAAFQGVPLALSRIGANEQCVEPGVNGFLFDPGDTVALQRSLRLLLLAGADGREKMGKATLEIARREFSAENIMPKIERIFQDVIDSCGKTEQTTSVRSGAAIRRAARND